MRRLLQRLWLPLLVLVLVLVGAALVRYMYTPLKPPFLEVTVNGVKQTGALGTYCWMGGGRGVCADAFAPVTPEEPVLTSSPLSAVIDLPLYRPAELTIDVFPATLAAGFDRPASGKRSWRMTRAMQEAAQRYDLSGQAAPHLDLFLEPGLHIIHVLARWSGLGGAVFGSGDGSFGFLVEVR